MKHARVLIADNDRRLRAQLYTRLLDIEVFSDSVSNISDAMEYMRDRKYGLVLLDLELPNGEAYGLIDQIRLLALVDRPMILATASRDLQPTIDPDLVQIIMRKPLRLADVADMIRSCLHSAIDAMSASDKRANGRIELTGGDEQPVRVVG